MAALESKVELITDDEFFEYIDDVTKQFFEGVPQLLAAATSAQAMAAEKQLGLTAFHQAAALGRLDCLRHLLASAADPESLATAQDNFGIEPIHWAAMFGHFDAVAVILEAAPSSDLYSGPQDMTVLSWAAYYGDYDAAKSTLDSIPWEVAILENVCGDTALHWAAKHGHAGAQESACKIPEGLCAGLCVGGVPAGASGMQ